MTLPQQNTASARPTSFYYLMCQLDRVQYQTPSLHNLFGTDMVRFYINTFLVLLQPFFPKKFKKVPFWYIIGPRGDQNGT